jgi:heme exporter protein CcmD
MIETLIHFMSMDGYGFYVWTAYSVAVIFLFIGWLRPWLRWHRYLRKLKNLSENERPL